MDVNAIRSEANIPFKCAIGPFRIANEPMKVSEPNVNDKANFCGLTAIIGSPTKKARAKNRADRKSRAQKTCKSGHIVRLNACEKGGVIQHVM
jgi:hypothetical protein